MRRFLVLAAGLAAVAGLLTWLCASYFAAEGIDLGLHGVIATYLCLLLIPVTSVGLMFLMRMSHRRGFDTRADTMARDLDDDAGPGI